MKGWTCLVLIALAACTPGDDVADGTRGLCAEGGELNDCNDAPQTPWDACWRMVDCGAIPVYEVEENQFDFDDCVEAIDSQLEAQRRLTIACIGASTCDQLRLRTGRCFLFGAN
ncbi:MAG TPA: hypothetical protein VIV11_00725 [Kofleriaceae bacterium]